jgi:hypothetical protein
MEIFFSPVTVVSSAGFPTPTSLASAAGCCDCDEFQVHTPVTAAGCAQRSVSGVADGWALPGVALIDMNRSMNASRIACLLILALISLCSAGGAVEKADRPRWKLNFHDEFDGHAMDTQKWNPNDS